MKNGKINSPAADKTGILQHTLLPDDTDIFEDGDSAPDAKSVNAVYKSEDGAENKNNGGRIPLKSVNLILSVLVVFLCVFFAVYKTTAYIAAKKQASAFAAFITGASQPSDGEQSAGGSLININTADEKELSALPGLGEKKAAAITEYRSENGPFNSIEEIKRVDGIGDGIFEKIKDLITVGPVT